MRRILFTLKTWIEQFIGVTGTAKSASWTTPRFDPWNPAQPGVEPVRIPVTTGSRPLHRIDR